MEENINFEEMIESSLNKSENFAPGDKVTGVIVEIGPENIFVDISSKSEAIIESSEFIDTNGNFTINTGDSIDAYIVSTNKDEIILTKNIGKGKLSPQILEIAFNKKIAIEGLIKSETKGGYTIMLSDIRAFCPHSLIDIKPIQDSNSIIGNKDKFIITKYSENGKNIVLSRKYLLEKELNLKKKDLESRLNLNDSVTATIESKKDFGLFVSIDGIQALIPKSEISWSRHSNNNLEIGNKVTAKIIELDWSKNKITLSIKQLTSEPWTRIEKISEGDEISGKVVNIINSGAFVEITEGIEGFLHISKLSYVKKIHNVEDILSKNDTVKVKILEIDKIKRRISLELLTKEQNPWISKNIDFDFKELVHSGVIETIQNQGINIRLENGMAGYIPKRELLNKNDSDFDKIYKVGATLKVSVIELNADKKNLILSEQKAKNIEETKEVSNYLKEEKVTSTSSLGSLFADKFNNIKKDLI